MRRAELASYFDAAALKPNLTPAELKRFCARCSAYGVYAADINPCNVSLAKRYLSGTGVKVLSVVGFPLGANTTQTKVLEARQALADGADELDVVMNIGRFRAKNYGYVLNELRSIVALAKGKVVKVIIEAGYLTKAEIVRACKLVVASGAAFVKDTSGWGPTGAQPKIIALMRKTVGSAFGVKAAGGIRTARQTLQLINAGANRIGSSAAFKILDEVRQ